MLVAANIFLFFFVVVNFYFVGNSCTSALMSALSHHLCQRCQSVSAFHLPLLLSCRVLHRFSFIQDSSLRPLCFGLPRFLTHTM